MSKKVFLEVKSRISKIKISRETMKDKIEIISKKLNTRKYFRKIGQKRSVQRSSVKLQEIPESEILETKGSEENY